jgi:hypothetical protein
MNKIVPIRDGEFESFHAFLAALMEDGDNVGFVGMVKRSDGSMATRAFGVTLAEVSFAAVTLAHESGKKDT